MTQKTKKIVIWGIVAIIVAIIIYQIYIYWKSKQSVKPTETGGGGGGGRACESEYTGGWTNVSNTDADTVVLRKGLKGEPVSFLQGKIGEVQDGYFGQCTETALMKKAGKNSITIGESKKL